MIAVVAYTVAIAISALAIYFPARRAKAKQCFSGYVLVFSAALLCCFGLLGWFELLVREVYPTYIPFMALVAGWFLAAGGHVGSLIWERMNAG